jgi:Calcineurin-like phosphoesterase
MLAHTGVKVALSTVFGAFADRRELEGLGGPRPGTPLDLSSAPGEYWFDYVADTGDGFDSVSTVASQLAAEELELTDGARGRLRLPAGSLLVLGGDECYPVASKANYTDRMVGPFRAMLPWTDRPRTLVALPGNHDWYDGLVSFLRQFCQGRWIGGWKTEQTRSYFAVKLPQGWWLWGIDVALGDDIDQPQLAYFHEMATLLEPDDSIILCWAMPSWVESGPNNPEAYEPLEFFERTVIPHRAMLRLSLSGDLHHYARYLGQDGAGQQKITAGGGGAYLYPTHRLPETLRLPPEESKDPNKRPPVEYTLQRRYPSAETSRRLRWGIFGAVFRSPKFPLVPALVYVIVGLTLSRAFPLLGRPGWWLPSVPVLGLALGLVGLVWLGLTRFTTKQGLRARLLGLVHTLAHLVFIVSSTVLGALADRAVGWAWPAVAVLFCVLLGALVGPLVTAGYLVFADLFGVNTDDLFSAQAIPDHKSFLRIRIAVDGTLTVFPIKIERSVRWEFAGPDDRPGDRRWFRPVDGVEPAPELLEPPITITKRPAPPPA